MNINKIAFALDPTLPWLFSDPNMQEPGAFHNMKTVTLSDWEPMGQYFPGGTQLAMRRVTSLDQLTEGAAYWHEWNVPAANGERVTSYSFGRYAGLAYPTSKSTPRRWKAKDVHIKLESDVLDCKIPLRDYYLHEDGTKVVFVHTGPSFSDATHTTYLITHYVNLAAPFLAELGPEAVKQSGLTLRQATWLKQEQELQRKSVELTMQMRGGLGLPDYRVVLPFDQVRDFLCAQETCKEITPGQARKCKSGALAITMRHSMNGRPYRITEHYSLVDGAILIDWIRHHSTVQDATLNAAISRQTIGHIAENFRTQQKAAQQAQGAAQASESEYAGVRKLAHAA